MRMFPETPLGNVFLDGDIILGREILKVPNIRFVCGALYKSQDLAL